MTDYNKFPDFWWIVGLFTLVFLAGFGLGYFLSFLLTYIGVTS